MAVSLTRDEYLVLRAAANSSNYQPSRAELPIAEHLSSRGLLAKDDGFPDVTVTTVEGWDAYMDAYADYEDDQA